MNAMARRTALRHLGWVAGSTSVALLRARPARATTTVETTRSEGGATDDAAEPGFWNYTTVAPDAAAACAYRHYAGHGCMYAVFRGLVETWGAARSASSVPFPFAMMDYGHGGSGGYGSLCGALNGAAAAISLFEPAPRLRDVLIVDLYKWYESAALPHFQPASGAALPTSVAGSVLCHASISRWCGASKEDPYSASRGERCRRLSADVTARTAEQLNRHLREPRRETAIPTDAAGDCLQCHAPKGRPEVTVRTLMSCTACHHVPTPHPAVPAGFTAIGPH